VCDASWIRYGLIAAMLSGTVEDYREIARTNSLLFRAAELGGFDPVTLFESAAEVADADSAETGMDSDSLAFGDSYLK
jgi:hypothetical protein